MSTVSQSLLIQPSSKINTALKILSELSPEVEEKDLLYQFSLSSELEIRTTVADKLLKAIKDCPRGDPDNSNIFPTKFENLCFNLIKLTLEDEFPNVKPIQHPRKDKIFGENIEIRDITIENRYKLLNVGILWNDLRTDTKVNCKIIVFECKNYEVNITRKEVLQLYEYLNPDVHGRFGIILCRNSDKLDA